MTSRGSDRTVWLAFRYIAEELSEAERSAFEERLAGDQAAREAVARAVEMALAVTAASDPRRISAPAPSVVRARQPAHWRRTTWVVIAAACLALVLVYQGFQIDRRVFDLRRVGNDSVASYSGDAASRELAVVWSQMRERLTQQTSGGWPLGLDDDEIGVDSTDLASSAFEDVEVESFRTPSWMWAAVLELHRGSDCEGDLDTGI